MTCSIGQSSTTGSASCTKCDLGTYGSSPGVCTKCIDQKEYQDTKGETKCLSCTLGEEWTSLISSCTKCTFGQYGSENGTCVNCNAGKFQDEPGKHECKDCSVDTYLSEKGKSSKADCTDCSSEKSTGNVEGNSNKEACLCKRTEYYTDADDNCVKCPTGADCSVKDGQTLTELTAKPGYWRPDPTSHIFSPCVVGYTSLNAQEIADERCCPLLYNISTNTSISICSNKTFNHTNEQCKQGYAGAICLVCAEGYVKLGSRCIACEGGASIGMAAIPLVIIWLVGLLLSLFLFIKCGKKVIKKRKKLKKQRWFGKSKCCIIGVNQSVTWFGKSTDLKQYHTLTILTFFFYIFFSRSFVSLLYLYHYTF